MAWKDEDRSSANNRAEARERRREARDTLREAREQLREVVDRLDRPDREQRNVYGLDLGDEKPHRETFGLSLLDREQVEHIAQLARDVDAMAEKISASDRSSWRRELADPKANEGPLGFASCAAGPALGPAPSVSLDGNNDWSVPLNWSLAQYSPFPTITPEFQYGHSKAPNGGVDTIVSADLGANGPMGSGRISLGTAYNVSQPERSRIYVQSRVLGLTCSVGVDAGRVLDAMQQRFEEAAKRHAPAAQQMLSPLNLPNSP